MHGEHRLHLAVKQGTDGGYSSPPCHGSRDARGVAGIGRLDWSSKNQAIGAAAGAPLPPILAGPGRGNLRKAVEKFGGVAEAALEQSIK